MSFNTFPATDITKTACVLADYLGLYTLLEDVAALLERDNLDLQRSLSIKRGEKPWGI